MLFDIRITGAKVTKNLLNHERQPEIPGGCQNDIKELFHALVFENQYREDAVQRQDGVDGEEVEHPVRLDEDLEGVEDGHHETDAPLYVQVPVIHLVRIISRDFFIRQPDENDHRDSCSDGIELLDEFSVLGLCQLLLDV